MASFRGFGLSEATLSGLEDCGYKEPTPIQTKAIPIGIEGKDILGAARTGSGKTLAFLIPVLERLDALKWSSVYGLGALIITPTRELAYQIYEVLRKVGKHHSFSAALIIGGKDLKFESSRLKNIDIIIGTPGRVKHHMDQNPEFDASSLQILVLDEADRILDLGFAPQINAIVENLPSTRQTLLFSATQTRSVKDLARLSLRDPVYVSADEDSPFATPETLVQTYIVMNVEDKLNFLWSFITFHRQKKTLVFLASCKQVKFFNELLCHLRPGVSVMALHGNQHQLKRMEVYDIFHRKEHAVLLATDVASRGLDFPNVDYVIQLDCPDDVVQYIHRAGRTARYNLNGVAVLAVTPTEEERFVPQLEAKKIPIERMEANHHHQKPIQLSSVLAKFPEMKESAQRAFKAYLKSIWMVHRQDGMTVNLEAYAKSLGLHTAPRIRFFERHRKEEAKKASKPMTKTDAERYLLGAEQMSKKDNILSAEGGDSDEDILKPKIRKEGGPPRVDVDENPSSTPVNRSEKIKFISKTALAKRMVKKGIIANTRLKFDDEGNVVSTEGKSLSVAGGDKGGHDEENSGLDLDEAKKLLSEADVQDRVSYRKRIKEKHRLERRKRKELRRKPGQPLAPGEQEDGGDTGVVLGSPDGEDDLDAVSSDFGETTAADTANLVRKRPFTRELKSLTVDLQLGQSKKQRSGGKKAEMTDNSGDYITDRDSMDTEKRRRSSELAVEVEPVLEKGRKEKKRILNSQNSDIQPEKNLSMPHASGNSKGADSRRVKRKLADRMEKPALFPSKKDVGRGTGNLSTDESLALQLLGGI